MRSLLDIWLVARFELVRALRTWRALALVTLYLVASSGAAWVFTRVIKLVEWELADKLGVTPTDTPGTMLSEFVSSDIWREMVGAMVGSEELAAHLVTLPPLATWHMWLGLLLVPFFAASAASESISLDLSSRSLRYEALRTGRLEIVFGRALGQTTLTAVATVVSLVAVWIVGMSFMVGNGPVELATALVTLSLRAWVFGLPFVGLGICCSQWTASAAWARVLAIGGTAGTWVLFGLARWGETTWAAPVADAALQILPQGWMRGLWEPGTGWFLSATVCAGLCVAAISLGFARFARRDL